MFKYIFKRLIKLVPIILGSAFFAFLIMQKTPGSYWDTLRMNPQISPETITHYQRLYGVDKPFLVQFWNWLWNIIRHLEFGYSFFYSVPVTKVIAGRLWNTFVLSLASFLFTWTVAIPLGIWAAVHRNKWIDHVIQFVSYFLLSLPSFFVAIVLLFWASQSGVLPLGGMYSPNYEDLGFFAKIWDVLKHLIIPTLALSIGSIGGLQKIMRGNMLEVLGQQYILAARAKGLPEDKVIYRHALRNAFNPLVTLLGYEFSGLLSGAVLIEIICSWPGIGSLMWTAVRSKDVYLVMGSLLMGGMLYIIGNLLADIMLAKLDPRIRYE